jgi:predicted GIY-YIG superfamily endonuclease
VTARPRRPPGPRAGASAGPVGTIYLVHFDHPYEHARHYTGWTEDLLDRLDRHARGHSARLMRVIWEAGIGFTLVRVREGTRGTERSIKNAGGAVRYCPLCTSRPRIGQWGELPADLVPRYYPCRPPEGPRWVLLNRDPARPLSQLVSAT